jgi:hypothetical protein
MRAVVVFESIFGNTQSVAEAIGDGLRGRAAVVVNEVSKAPTALVGIDLLVMGGPIHAWSMSRELTRKIARSSSQDPPSAGIGLREYLKQLPDVHGSVTAATFDTALRAGCWVPTGSAAKPAARQLEARGFHLLVKPEHFYVAATEGPLEPGELERARAWGVGLADALVRLR